jgi:hypothetical protein
MHNYIFLYLQNSLLRITIHSGPNIIRTAEQHMLPPHNAIQQAAAVIYCNILWTGAFGVVKLWTGAFGVVKLWTGAFAVVKLWTGAFGVVKLWTGAFGVVKLWTGAFGVVKLWTGAFGVVKLWTGAFGVLKITNWKERSSNRAVWEKSIKEGKIRTGMSCYLRTRK